MRKYKCLQKQIFRRNQYCLSPIQDGDKYKIMFWRNEQIEILRQNIILTKSDQLLYFKNSVDTLFHQERPLNILWRFLYKGQLIGYGGLVHIDWSKLSAEISFLTKTDRNSDEIFRSDFHNYLQIIFRITFEDLKIRKIYTTVYDLKSRSAYIEVIHQNGFEIDKTFNKPIEKVGYNYKIYSYTNLGSK